MSNDDSRRFWQTGMEAGGTIQVGGLNAVQVISAIYHKIPLLTAIMIRAINYTRDPRPVRLATATGRSLCGTRQAVTFEAIQLAIFASGGAYCPAEVGPTLHNASIPTLEGVITCVIFMQPLICSYSAGPLVFALELSPTQRWLSYQHAARGSMCQPEWVWVFLDNRQ